MIHLYSLPELVILYNLISKDVSWYVWWRKTLVSLTSWKKSPKYRFARRVYFRVFHSFWFIGFSLLSMSVIEIKWICSLYCSLSKETSQSSNHPAISEIISNYWVHPCLAIANGHKIVFLYLFQLAFFTGKTKWSKIFWI
jgi:hypothetical protein